MNRFWKYVFGIKPTPGTYWCGDYKRKLPKEDIGEKYVRIHYKHLEDSILTYREFHVSYTQTKREFH